MTDKVVSLEVYRQKRIIKEIDEPEVMETELLEVLSEYYGIPDDYEGDDE